MNEETRKRLSELILEELSEKIRGQESLRRKLEAFTELPVEKVATAILNQFEYLLSSDLRDLIIQLVEQELESEQPAEIPQARHDSVLPSKAETDEQSEPAMIEPADDRSSMDEVDDTVQEAEHLTSSSESIMEHFGVREPFPSEPLDLKIQPGDWFYMYGFSYAPDSTGKGIPSRKLMMKGVDKASNIFIVDYGDVRLYMNKMNPDDYVLDKSGRPTLSSTQDTVVKFEHERILNVLRSEDVLVPAPFWTVIQGLVKMIRIVEDRYVELLRALIDVHDITDWDVDILADDEHLLRVPSIIEGSKLRTSTRESKHVTSKVRDIKLTEKVIFKEKSLAQEIHNELLVHAIKSKVDYMVRLDSAIMGDWKSILSARYVVGKEKRRTFFQALARLQEQYGEFQLMMRVTNPTSRFSLV